MQFINRRIFISALAATALAACDSRAQSNTLSVTGATGLPLDLKPVSNAAFDTWVTNFRPRALSQGISSDTFDAAFAEAGYLPGVVTRDGSQIQTRRTLEDYLSIVVSDDRVTKGRATFRRLNGTFSAIEAKYGVEAHVIAAIWGAESQYGERRGLVPVVSSTATLAFDGRRGAFYESQLIAALKILQRGDTTPDKLTGSWAGAMGHTQFIPTSYQSFAVDFTGDGRRDIWDDDPSDALASAAAYLARNGWQRGVKWGGEEGAGVQGRIIQPQAGGIRFAVTRNFNVIKTYNNSDFYAIGIGHLSDRIAGGGPLQGSFPPDANGLTKADRIALQQGLADLGYDIGTIDGVVGAKTEAAIRDLQTRRGQTATGVASRAVLNLL